MTRLGISVVLGLLLSIISFAPLHAQAGGAQADANPTGANPAPAGQAPDEVMKKLTELVHTGKYAEAQQLTGGLLLAYPDDQRLIKAKTLLDKAFASSKPADPAASSNLPANNVASVLPTASVNSEQLTGMDKVDYNALVELARQAQQTADLPQQSKLLRQFMDQSSPFLQKHPMQTLVWQLRAASAISLNDPMAGYEAGQKLLATGAADSNDPNLQRLLAQLKNQGWLDKQEAEKAAKQAQYDWILGDVQFRGTLTDKQGREKSTSSGGAKISFVKSGSIIEGLWDGKPFLEFVVLDSGAISCELKGDWFDRGSLRSCEIDSGKRTLKVVDTDKYHTPWTTFLSK